jgi:hypothetical protein
MNTGIQFVGNLTPNQTARWFTHNWNPASHIIWYLVPTTPRPGAPELQWSVGVERASATACTYWLTVTNLTNAAIAFEARFAVLS